MGADVVYDAFQSPGGVHQLVYLFLVLVGVLQLWVDPERVLQGPGLKRDHAGNAVDLAVAHAQCPAYVTQRGFGSQRAECDDLGHPVAAEALDHVVEHFVPPVVLKVQVDIGHLLAFHVQETLKDQPVFQGVHVGDAQGIQCHAGGGAAPYRVHDPAALHEADDVPDHQEIVGKPGVPDDVELVCQALLLLRRGMGITLVEAFPAYLGQVLVGINLVGGGILGEVSLVEVQLHVAHVGD